MKVHYLARLRLVFLTIIAGLFLVGSAFAADQEAEGAATDVETQGMQEGDFVENDAYRITVSSEVYNIRYALNGVDLLITDFETGSETMLSLELMVSRQPYLEAILLGVGDCALVVSEYLGNEIFIIDLAHSTVIETLYSGYFSKYALSPDQRLFAYNHRLPARGVEPVFLRDMVYVYDLLASPEENQLLTETRNEMGLIQSTSGLPLFPDANRQAINPGLLLEETGYRLMSPLIWHPTRPLLAFMAMTHEELDAEGRFQEVQLVTLHCNHPEQPLDPASWHSEAATFEPHSLMDPEEFERLVKQSRFGGIQFANLAWEGDDAIIAEYTETTGDILGYEQITVPLP